MEGLLWDLIIAIVANIIVAEIFNHEKDSTTNQSYQKNITPRLTEITDPVIWAPSEYAEWLAKQLGVDLIRIPKNWLPEVPEKFTKRKIKLAKIKDLEVQEFPCFIKLPIEKGFKAKVFNSLDEFAKEPKIPLDLEAEILIQEPVEWEVEYRVYICNGEPKTWAPYRRDNKTNKQEFRDEEVEQFKAFIEELKKEVWLPRTCALDVGIIKSKGWAVIEANGAYGSGIYKCEPDKILDVLWETTVD